MGKDNLLPTGTQVRCRFCHSKTGEFYGKEWTTSIVEVDSKHKTNNVFRTPYKVYEPATEYYVWLMQKEILEVIPEKGNVAVSE